MASIKTLIHAEIDPRQPVPEILTIIRAVTPFHPGQEEAILIGVMEALEKRIIILKKGAEKNDEPLHESGRQQTNKGELGPAQ